MNTKAAYVSAEWGDIGKTRNKTHQVQYSAKKRLTLVANFLRSIVSKRRDFRAGATATVITRNFLTYFVCTNRNANCAEYITACIEVAQEFECCTGAHFRRDAMCRLNVLNCAED